MRYLLLLLFALDCCGQIAVSRRVGFTTRQVAGHWNFEEGSGTTVADISGSGDDGTASGGMTWVTGQVGAYAGGFDGVDDYVSVTDDATLDKGTSDFSIAAWVYINSATGGAIVWKALSSTPFTGYIFRIAPNGKLEFNFHTTDSYPGNSLNVVSDDVISTGSWVHVAVAFDRSALAELYVDGVFVKSKDMSGEGASVDNSSDLWIGRFDQGSAVYLDGDIDDVRIYDRVIGPTEIRHISLIE
jgi:hypothetical protein